MALRVLGSEVELVGSTHQERMRALSDAISKTNPVTDKVRFDALFDAYLICLEYDRGAGE